MKRPRYRYESQLMPPDPNEPPVLEPLSPTGGPLSPQPRPKYHDDWCFCENCTDIRASLDLYLSQKKLWDANGFN